LVIPDELKQILSSDPETLGGTVCFTNTRIPVSILLDNLEAGTPWEEFYDDYPSLTPALVKPVIAWENRQAKRILGLELVN